MFLSLLLPDLHEGSDLRIFSLRAGLQQLELDWFRIELEVAAILFHLSLQDRCGVLVFTRQELRATRQHDHLCAKPLEALS